MRKLFIWEFLSLDGVMESPEKWVNPYFSEDVWEFIRIQNLEADDYLLGRLTYEAFLTFWPSQTNNEFGFADHLNRQCKYVVSSILEKTEWNNSTLIKGNLIEEVTSLKQQPGGSIGITGSATLVQALMQAKLIDEYRLLVYPLILGDGMCLFRDAMDRSTLKLVEAKPLSTGVLALTYQLNRNGD